jgi:predicted P-loop ATPase
MADGARMLPTVKLGATRAEWNHFKDLCGGASALLPAVADAKAKIRSGSKLRPEQLGKIPSRYTNGEAVGFGKWTAYQATPSDVRAWADHGGYSICIQSRIDGLQAVDIDIADPAEAAQVVSFIEDHLLQRVPVRYRANSGKVLIPIRVAKAIRKRVVKTRHGNIELLGDGQQFVAAGTHPSGERYQWKMSDGDARLPADIDVPALTLEQFEDLAAALQNEYGIAPIVQGNASTAPRSEVMARVHTNDPVAKFLLENAWVHDAKPDLSLIIRCPFEKGHSTGQAGDTSTLYFPAHTNGYEQGHFKCLHASCSHRADHEFLQECGFELAIVTGEMVLPALAAADTGPAFATNEDFYRKEAQRFLDLKLPRDKAGRLDATLPNLARALPFDTVLGCAISYDTFRQVGTVAWAGEGMRSITDADIVKIRERLEKAPFRFKPVGKEIMRDALVAYFDRNSYDSAVAWLRALPPWDGTSRVERLLPAYLGAQDTPYSRAVGRYLMSALIGRMLATSTPFKADMVPILVGEQGAGKSTFLSLLAPVGSQHVELDLALSEADRARHTHGVVMVELGELKGFAKRDQAEHKAWISRTTDVFVRKYQDNKSEVVRRFICVGTTNEDEFLQDDSGERRYLPVKVDRLDHEQLKADRNQLYAEALVTFELFGADFEDAERLARDEHAQFKVASIWFEKIAEYLAGDDTLSDSAPKNGVSLDHILVAGVGLSVKDLNSGSRREGARAMRALGWRDDKLKVDGHTVRRWFRI